jgi:hypothetical protein
MRIKALLALTGLLALAFVVVGDSYAQRGGRGGVHGGAVSAAHVVGPYGGGGGGFRSAATVIGPAGGARTVKSVSTSFTTPGGKTVTRSATTRTVAGPGGVVASHTVGGVSVTGPGGRTVSRVGTVSGIKGPAMGPGGMVFGGTRAGVGVGPGGVVGGGAHWSAAGNPYTGFLAGGRLGAARFRPTYFSPALLRTSAIPIRRGFVNYHYFTPNWYTSHPLAWRAAAWNRWNFWRWAPWPTIAQFCGYPMSPPIYDYGSNLVYEDNQVFYNGEPIATADEYAAQATDLALAGDAAKPPDNDEWTSLGVFAMIQGDEQESNNIFQLAIDRNGVIRGNYHNALTDSTLPVYGSVDKKTQRAAWIVGTKKDVVYETGIGNLSEGETTMLVHFGKDNTQQWKLIRLDPPKDE